MQHINLLHSKVLSSILLAILSLLVSPRLQGGNLPAVNPRFRFLQDMNPRRSVEASDIAKSLKQDEPETYIPLIVELTTPDAPLPEGVNEWRRRGNLALVTINSADLNILAGWESVTRIEASRDHSPSMNLALQWCSMPSLRSLTQSLPLTGKNVVVGFCDTGFDPHHINFNPSPCNTRVKKLVNATAYAPYPTVLDTPDEIAGWVTDSGLQTHATHVAGILAGGYDFDGVIGIATEAEIVGCTSQLKDAYILDGFEQILEYANAQGRPAVANLSASSAIGPHDGTTLFNEYVSMLAEEMTICISAGNDGNRPGTIYHTFSDATPLRFYPVDWPSWIRNYARGAVDIWTDSPDDLTVNLVEIDNTTHEIINRWSGESLKSFEPFLVCDENYAEEFPDIKSSELPEHLHGFFYAASDMDPRNHRYNVLVELLYNSSISYPAPPSSNIGIELIGRPGTKVEVYSTSAIYLNKNYDPCGITGSSFNAINDFCMKGNVICVGSFNTRDYIPHLDAAYTPRPQSPVGEISYFSSYGDRPDGTILPDVVAPGAYIVSSLSTPFINANPQDIATSVSSQTTIDGTTYYWGPDQGTSMSSPYVAGTIALWLEQFPDLAPAEIRRILRETSAIPQGATDPRHWGAGMFDALAGYEMAGKLPSSSHLPTAGTSGDLSVKYSDAGVYILSTPDAPAQLSLTSIAGATLPRTVFTPVAEGINFLDFNTLSAGIYIVHAPGSRPVKITVGK